MNCGFLDYFVHHPVVQNDYSQFCAFMIFREQDKVGEEHNPGSTSQKGDGGTGGGAFLTSVSGVKRTGDLFFLHPWSGVAKSDFLDFEFVIIIRETGWKFTFVSLVRQACEISIVNI